MIFLYVAIGLILLELIVMLLVRNLRKDFQWLITEDDELPELPRAALDKFINSSFDTQLGWVRKPNTSGIEKGKNGDISFTIDANGARKSSTPDAEQSIAAFGDSYAFCRQVMDTETWEEGISGTLKTGVMNFGVGNYGIDQALIRYKQERLPGTIKIVILCFVPETICRIQSYWKHYLEFGNTFAFKPRFKVTDAGELQLVKSAIQSPEDFDALKEKLPEVRKHDKFYHGKFRKYQFRTPYLISLFRAPRRQFPLLRTLAGNRLLRLFNNKCEPSNNRAFAMVMKDNIREAQKMYSDNNARLLLKKILLNFKETAEQKGHKPVLLVIPQLLDFGQDKYREMPYSAFYKSLEGEHEVIDMADIFRKEELADIYINDQYGGHLSAKGNELVAASVTDWVKKINSSRFQN